MNSSMGDNNLNYLCRYNIKKKHLYLKSSDTDKEINYSLVLNEIVYKNYAKFIQEFEKNYQYKEKIKGYDLFFQLYERLKDFNKNIYLNDYSSHFFTYKEESESNQIPDGNTPFFINYEKDYNIDNLFDALNINNIL